MGRIRVGEPGLLATVQDLGRLGCAHLGVSPTGAVDAFSLRAGNLLAGNPDGAAAIESTLIGGRFVFEHDAVVAITGGEFEPYLDSRRVPQWRAIEIRSGSELRLGRALRGCRSYLCVSGGIQVPPVLGSRSTDLRGGFGGCHSRALRHGDRLHTGPPTGRHSREDASALRYYVRPGTLRVTRTPDAALFPESALHALFSTPYVVRADSDRLGVRVSGSAVLPASPVHMITEGMPLGAVQIPPDGQPIILLVDQQTTGGYPKPACVISADLPRAGQLQPGDRVRFVEVDLDTAYAALRDIEDRITMLRGDFP